MIVIEIAAGVWLGLILWDLCNKLDKADKEDEDIENIY
jgi:capsular polysaccharide biosynthesis protein